MAEARDPRALARTFLSQALAAEGEVLMLEESSRAGVLTSLNANKPVETSASTPADRMPLADRLEAASAASTAATAATASTASTASSGSKASPSFAPIADSDISEAPDLAALAELVARCGRCGLHEARKQAVFGEGAADARVVCVGEAPGAREDETGRPFVGRAGQLLDRLLLTIGLPRSSVYICNVLKSRPPQNRDPLPDEVAACSPYLLKQLALIQPDVIVAFGAFAARTLLETKSALGRLRGRVHEYSGFPVVVTYHPAALLRNPGWVRPSWEDLQIVRRLLDEADENAEANG